MREQDVRRFTQPNALISAIFTLSRESIQYLTLISETYEVLTVLEPFPSCETKTMRHSIGILISLPVFVFIVGCGKPTPPRAGGKPTHSARIPEGLDNRHAANYLAGAKHLLEIGEQEQAVATLNELIANYPKSDVADEAKKILADLEKLDVDTDEDIDGGVVQNPDREKAREFLDALSKVKSVEEETKLSIEFGAWLRERDYKVEVTTVDGRSLVSCPYFPPETPWVEHSFLDNSNLGLLPRMNGGE